MQAVAQRFADIGERFEHEAPDVSTTLGLIAALAVQVVPSAEHAGITRVVSGSLHSVGATSSVVEQVDALQYELGSGPCVDAAIEKNVYVGNDLVADTRWPIFGRRAADEHGVRSMVSFRIYLEQDPLIAALNLYAHTVDAFTEHDIALGLLLTTHGAIALAAAGARDRAAHLTAAVHSNRRIGIAIGIVMAQHKVTQDQAWDLLRITSQDTQRKVRDIAEDVIDTGTLPEVPNQHHAAD